MEVMVLCLVCTCQQRVRATTLDIEICLHLGALEQLRGQEFACIMKLRSTDCFRSIMAVAIMKGLAASSSGIKYLHFVAQSRVRYFNCTYLQTFQFLFPADF
jgi:hypothetical protein